MTDRAIRGWLAFGDLAVLATFVGAIICVPNIHLSDTMIGVILGLLGALVKDSHGFWYSTSAGSTAKDAMLAASNPVDTKKVKELAEADVITK